MIFVLVFLSLFCSYTHLLTYYLDSPFEMTNSITCTSTEGPYHYADKGAYTFGATEATKSPSDMHPPAHDVSGDILDDGLRRGLKGRHFVIIALGSIIGPGTFWGLGYAIFLSGPLGALLGFSIVGVSVWFLMQSVGEITTLFPIHGGFVEVNVPFTDIKSYQS